MNGIDWPGALIAGGPLLLIGFAAWVSLTLVEWRERRNEWRARRAEWCARAKVRHPAKGDLPLPGCFPQADSAEWLRIVAALTRDEPAEGQR